MLRGADRGTKAGLSLSGPGPGAAARLLAALALGALPFVAAPTRAEAGEVTAGGDFAADGVAAPAATPPPRLSLPVRCAPGTDCFIQNYVDHDPGPGWRDYGCGALSYDGHNGTDFRVPSLVEMERGVQVLAAADGVVAAVRDGEPDVSVRVRGREGLGGKDAGNGVRVRHDGGWETQYSHLRNGSVQVRPGQRVSAGDVLGLVGLSGNTEFPHVDFVVRHRSRTVDPFAPAGAPQGEDAARCADRPLPDTLWSEEAAAALRYQASGVLVAGFAAEAPDPAKAQRGGYRDPVAASAPVLAFWVESFGPRRGDLERFELRAPDGSVLARRAQPIARNYAVRFSYLGLKRREPGWPAGEYTARYALEREGRVVAQAEARTTLR